MNKLKYIKLMSLTLIMFPVFVSGQWTTSGTNIYNTNTGNVGIGTSNPDRTLAVTGQLGLSGATPAVVFKYVGSSTKVWDIASFGNDLAINETGILSRFILKSGGNVGIGTSNPTEKLSVNGKIRAHEIKVETANWPDYVFSKNYNLPALQSVEKHIKEEGYLPDMPSAKEVESNGINVGEMNGKLLKKIEELTLYLIDLDKKVNKLDTENKELKGLLLNSKLKKIK